MTIFPILAWLLATYQSHTVLYQKRGGCGFAVKIQKPRHVILRYQLLLSRYSLPLQEHAQPLPEDKCTFFLPSPSIFCWQHWTNTGPKQTFAAEITNLFTFFFFFSLQASWNFNIEWGGGGNYIMVAIGSRANHRMSRFESYTTLIVALQHFNQKLCWGCRHGTALMGSGTLHIWVSQPPPSFGPSQDLLWPFGPNPSPPPPCSLSPTLCQLAEHGERKHAREVQTVLSLATHHPGLRKCSVPPSCSFDQQSSEHEGDRECLSPSAARPKMANAGLVPTATGTAFIWPLNGIYPK